MPEGESGRFDFYGAQYARFAGELAREMRREVYGVDIACGSGGPSLALVERSGCRLTGIDVEAAAIAYAGAEAAARGLADPARFIARDCGGRMPFADGAFAA